MLTRLDSRQRKNRLQVGQRIRHYFNIVAYISVRREMRFILITFKGKNESVKINKTQPVFLVILSQQDNIQRGRD